METKMPFPSQESNGIIILKAENERLDSNIAPELKTQILVLAEEGHDKVLLDLSRVVYVDSSGLGAILFGVRQFRDRGGALRIFGAKERVQHLIKIAKLEEVVLNYASEADAINSFSE